MSTALQTDSCKETTIMTKRLFYITGITALTVLLASCSGDAYEGIDPGTSPVTYSNDSVPIVLATTNAATVTTRVDNISELDEIGVFCMALNSENTTTGDLLFPLQNVAASASSTNSETTTPLSWKSDTIYYYPYSSPYRYGFAGYYPRVNDDAITYDSSTGTISINYTNLDGKTDIIAAYASSEDEYAYSAQYYRNGGRDIPTLNFNHYLMKWNVTVANGTTIDHIVIKDMPTTATLTITAAGVTLGTGTEYTGSFSVDCSNGSATVYVPVIANKETYSIDLYSTADDTTPLTTKKLTLTSDDISWEMGYSYEVEVKIE